MLTKSIEAPPAEAAEPRRSVGRPRSAATRGQILAATVRLLQTQSVQGITIEAIAREAGVGKATIYRWWDSKALVVIDAFMDQYIVKTPIVRNRSPGDALALHIGSIVREYAGWSGRIVAQIIAEGQSDPDVMREFTKRFIHGRRAVAHELIEAWQRTDNIPTPPNVDVLCDLLYAPIYMRLLLSLGPLDEVFVREHIAYMYQLLGVKPPDMDRSSAPGLPADAAVPVRRRATALAK